MQGSIHLFLLCHHHYYCDHHHQDNLRLSMLVILQYNQILYFWLNKKVMPLNSVNCTVTISWSNVNFPTNESFCILVVLMSGDTHNITWGRLSQNAQTLEMSCSSSIKWCKNFNILGNHQNLGCQLMPRGACNSI